MRVSYDFLELKGNGRVFLRKNNSVAYFPNDYSYYFGVSVLNNFDQPIKIFDSIIASEATKILVGKRHAILTINNKKHKIILGDNCINLDYPTEQHLDLDFREIYDFRTEGRHYEVNKNKYFEIKCVQGEKTYWVIIDGELKLNQEWIKKDYLFDKSRNDNGEYWVHRIGTIKGKARISWHKEKNTAIKNLKNLKEETYENFEEILDHNLSNLVMNDRLFAGLPWFFQAWTRDELISLVGYEPGLRKKILLNYLGSLLPDGRLPNRLPHANLGSADSIGLLAFRIKQNKILFTETEKKKLLKLFIKAEKLLRKNYMIQGLIWNRPNETWMDTNGRSGYCIEIQALYACLLDVIKTLSGEAKLEEFIKNVRSKFANVDNLEDNTIRPNIFLAYYYYPKLFEKKVWIEKFERVIKECWLEWGGFSTISKNHQLFHSEDAGISDKSYHNGNSWFFINNIAAIAMHKVRIHEDKARKIYLASKHELLSSGLLGCSTEISDAKEISSKGCLHQNWSLATLKELDLILKNPDNSVNNSAND